MVAGLILLVLAVLGAGALLISSAHASLTADSQAIAKVGMPLGGGKIESVTVVTGRSNQPVPVRVDGDKIYAQKLVAAGQPLTVNVVIKRPGWIAWLAGKTQTLTLHLTTPTASLRSHFITVSAHSPLRLHFKAPISAYSYGLQGHLKRHVLAAPSAVITLPRTATAGSMFVSAQPLAWESSHTAVFSWFPGGGKASVVANPQPGSTIKPTTPITLTFSRPVSKVLGSHLPVVSPSSVHGSWHQVGTHAMVFDPSGYGWGLGAKVQLGLPASVRLVDGQHASSGSWTVPGGSTVRLQQLLAQLGYLPLRFKYAGAHVALTPGAQEEAAIKPPAGSFALRWSNIPGWYKGEWAAGTYGELTKGAVMAFENTQGMTADGVDGPAVWNALMAAVIHHQTNSFGYTVVRVSEGSPETESTWHNGHTVDGGLVNTGGASTPTAQGTFAVFEHSPSVTMSGTNPDGSHYVDPGIPWVSYFNGGDALHGFIRAS